MARTPDTERRRQLLDALIAEFATGGIGDRSLREVAAAVGTSHRMLLHHFGSREDLLVAIVEEVERRQMGLLAELPADPAGSFAAMWADLRRPELRESERLFFECYARAVQGEKPFARMVPGAVTGWLAEVDAIAEDRSNPPWRDWDWPSPAACCWIWWPPTTTPVWTPPRRPSPNSSGVSDDSRARRQEAAAASPMFIP
ncbi:hypothetical protein MMAN_57920 [Mycobacterium mantenii]|uniref:HTH tetR-type domain-containing protein n=1 Tax=Mycobacterium mantenii TaxID=560555 RepID=A0ABM7K1C3_MYCNT|nr:hypothetical protein MMAN_57920 [Mycobacterium mantenii]